MSSAAESIVLFLSAKLSPVRLITSLFGMLNITVEAKENPCGVAFAQLLCKKKMQEVSLQFDTSYPKGHSSQPKISLRQKHYLGSTFTELK
jgi:hypothetical protein